MKTYHLLLACLCVQTAFTQVAVAPATPAYSTDKQSEAAELARQANDKLQQASSQQDYYDAAALFEQSVKFDPENLDVRQTLGWVYLDKLNDPRAAYRHLAKLAKNRPDDANARKLFGMACSQTGRPHQAVEEFRAASRLQPDDLWVRAQLARSLAQTGKFSEAKEIYADILKTDPSNADARLGQAEIDAWHGQTSAPLQTLDQLVSENPTNADVLTLRGDIYRWNWNLTEAEQDYQRVLDAQPNNYLAESGMEEAEKMGATDVGVHAYYFKDTTHFLRESLDASTRIHVADKVYLLGDVAGWRFTNPGFHTLNRADGAAGLEIHIAQWLEAMGEGTVFDYDHSRADFGGKFSTKISPLTGTDIYANLAYEQPFVSSISTVTSGMKENSVGAGIDTKLVDRFSFQATGEAARLSDDNEWWEAKPQLSYHLLDKPSTFIRAEYDYLAYEHSRTNYWTPLHRHTIGPVLDTSVPICKYFHIDADVRAPYVIDQSQWGFQVEGGPVIDLCNHVQAKASYYYSSLPGDQGAWSGQGWQASLQVRF